MVTVGPLAVATVSDKDVVFELLIPNSTRDDVRYKRNDHMGEANSLLNWTPIAKSEVGNWTEAGAVKVSSCTQTRDSYNRNRRPHTAEDREKIKHALDNRIREANIPYVEGDAFAALAARLNNAAAPASCSFSACAAAAAGRFCSARLFFFFTLGGKSGCLVPEEEGGGGVKSISLLPSAGGEGGGGVCALGGKSGCLVPEGERGGVKSVSLAPTVRLRMCH
jgi:hypothetical protein